MADIVKHWPSWSNWYTRDADGSTAYWECKPNIPSKRDFDWSHGQDGGWKTHVYRDTGLELVEIDPDTDWKDSLQRKPDNDS